MLPDADAFFADRSRAQAVVVPADLAAADPQGPRRPAPTRPRSRTRRTSCGSCLVWKLTFERTLTEGKRLFGDRYLLVRNEDLRSDPVRRPRPRSTPRSGARCRPRCRAWAGANVRAPEPVYAADDPRWAEELAPCRHRRRPAGRRRLFRGPRRYAEPVKATVLIRPKEGILDPQGKAVERALPALGFSGVSRRARRPHGRARGRERGRPSLAVREAPREPPDRGLRNRRMRFGVLQFPGSCDERDALGACERAGEARMVWHEDTDLSGHRRGGRPRRLLLRRLPARRGDRPLLPRDGRRRGVRRCRRPGARDLQRLPGPVRGGAPARRAASQRERALPLPPGRPRRGERRDSVHPRVRGRPEPLDPGQAHVGPLLRAARDAGRAGGERAGRAALRARPEPERVRTRHRRRPQRRGERDGPDAAPRARGRSFDRLGRRPASCSPRWPPCPQRCSAHAEAPSTALPAFDRGSGDPGWPDHGPARPRRDRRPARRDDLVVARRYPLAPGVCARRKAGQGAPLLRPLLGRAGGSGRPPGSLRPPVPPPGGQAHRRVDAPLHA